MSAASVSSRAHPPLDDATHAPPAERCVSCGAPIGTPYCAECGEQRASDRHYTLLHFGEEVLETFTHADGRLVRTLRTLVARPGELTVAYMAGQRRRYLAPLQLFLIVNLVVLLISESRFGIRTFNTPLDIHMHAEPYSALVSPLVLARVAARHTTLAAYAVGFDRTAAAVAHSLLILLVPLVAMATALVTLPRLSFAVRHVVFALHVLAAMMVILLLGWASIMAVALAALGAGAHFSMGDAAFSILLALAFGAYLARALQVAYDEGRVASVARAIVLVMALFPIITLYRFVLFYVTFYTT